MSIDGSFSERSLSPPPLIMRNQTADAECQADLTPALHEVTIEGQRFELPLYCMDPWTEGYVEDPVIVACGCIFNRSTFTEFPDDEITCNAHGIEVDKTFIFEPHELPARIKEIYSIVLEKLGHAVESRDTEVECEVVEKNPVPHEISLTTLPATYIDPITRKFIDKATLAACGCIFNRATLYAEQEVTCPNHHIIVDRSQLIDQPELTQKIRHFVLQVRSAMHTLPPLHVPSQRRLGIPPLMAIEPKIPSSPVRHPVQNSHVVTPKGRHVRRIYPEKN